MKTQKLLDKHPKATKELKVWWGKKIDAALSSENLAEEYKALVKEKQIDEQQIIRTIDNNPHTLFEFFDEMGMYIEEYLLSGSENITPKFYCSIGKKYTSITYKTRNEAERDVLNEAFKLLEEML